MSLSTKITIANPNPHIIMHITPLILFLSLLSLYHSSQSDFVSEIESMYTNAVEQFNKGNYYSSEKIWRDLVKLIPQLKEVY